MKRAVLLLIATLALAGCGGGDNGTTAPSTSAASTPAPGQASSEPVRISLKDIAFHPENVAVHEGQAVRWTNDDTVAHTVVATSGATFDSGTLDPDKGAFYEATMRNAGNVAYHCTIHPNMTGTIKIVP